MATATRSAPKKKAVKRKTAPKCSRVKKRRGQADEQGVFEGMDETNPKIEGKLKKWLAPKDEWQEIGNEMRAARLVLETEMTDAGLAKYVSKKLGRGCEMSVGEPHVKETKVPKDDNAKAA